MQTNEKAPQRSYMIVVTCVEFGHDSSIFLKVLGKISSLVASTINGNHELHISI
jgi:hypothetical protein